LLFSACGRFPRAVLETDFGTVVVRLRPDQAPIAVSNFIGLAEGTRPFTDSLTGARKTGRYYDGTTFHRVVRKFVVQGGDPTGTGEGGPGYRFPDEINADALGLDAITIEDFQQELDGQVRESVLKMLLSGAPQTSVKKLYEIEGYRYVDRGGGLRNGRGAVAMANNGPDANGSQFFVNLADNRALNGRHTVFGEVVEGMEVVDKIAAVPVSRDQRPIQPVRLLRVIVRK
jgi:peptidyl-prolyl cis-trans isomerase A (cyclophilin A)